MKIKFKRHSRKIFSFFVISIIFLLSFFKVFYNYELLFYDALFRLRPSFDTHKDIVIIEISDDTLKNLGQWPLPRDFHASLVDILSEYKARVILFDIFFSEPSIYDELFSDSIKKAKNVYIPKVFDLDSRLRLKKGLAQARGIISSDELFLDAAKSSGHINTFIEPDGKIRRVPLFIKYNEALIPQLSLSVACDYLGLDINNVSFKGREVIVDNKLILPVSYENSFLINFPARWGEAFRHLSYYEVLKAYRDTKEEESASLDLTSLEGKICIIGLTAAGTPDIRAIPLERSYPLVGLQASVLNSIITSRFIREIPPIFSVFISLLLFLLALRCSLKCGPLKAFVITLAVTFIYLMIAVVAFMFMGVWLDIFLILFIISATYITTTIFKFLDEIRKRQILEKELQIARDIQRSFLPQDIKDFGPIKIAAVMEPAKFVAGDLYDVVRLDENRLGVFIGDVAGKGASASLIMAQTVSLFRVFSRSTDNPAQVLTQLNKELCKILQGRFVTAMYLIIDVKEALITASCAGHNPIVFYNAKESRVSEVLPDSGPPLGVIDILEYEAFQEKINKNDRLFLYTDGVSEARNKKGQEYGLEKVFQSLIKEKNTQVKELVSKLQTDVMNFQHGLPQHDDITLILLDFAT